MKTLCLLGSPRRGGNSDTLAHRFVQQAALYNAAAQTIALSELSYRGCINLFDCKNALNHCGQTDDLTPVLLAISQSQVLVLASPVYFTSLSGQMKLAIDRFFSFFVPDYPTATVKSRLSPNRHLVLLQTQGEPEDRYADLLQQYSASFTGLGFNNLHLVRAWGVREPGDLALHPEFMEECDQIARRVYKPDD